MESKANGMLFTSMQEEYWVMSKDTYHPTESVDVQHSFVVAHIHPMPKTGFVTSFTVSHFWQAALCIIR